MSCNDDKMLVRIKRTHDMFLVEVLLVDGNGNLESSSVVDVVDVVAIVGGVALLDASRLDDTRPRFARTDAASKDARRRVGEGGDGA